MHPSPFAPPTRPDAVDEPTPLDVLVLPPDPFPQVDPPVAPPVEQPRPEPDPLDPLDPVPPPQPELEPA